mgnify:CR=1 FL=1
MNPAQRAVIYMMGYVRRGLYRLGYRPRLGSIFFSPSLDMRYAWREYAPNFIKAMNQQLKEQHEDHPG